VTWLEIAWRRGLESGGMLRNLRGRLTLAENEAASRNAVLWLATHGDEH